ncbi:MAG: type II toxin-antitoxin system RelE/ParE family toxin [Magnetococcales bacterium]|nr:type II toxin-antitoxin system RelE/ParE family toxin [Magnetococcales bacterium]
MSHVLIRPKAESDLAEIWCYIAQDTPAHADKLLDRIAESCSVLAIFPNTGSNRCELMPGMRSFSVENYLIFYLPMDDGIEVVRVLHGVRNIGTDYFQQPDKSTNQ